MRKLELKIDDLAVETFAVAERAEEPGTVFGNVPTRMASCYLTNCPWDCSYFEDTNCCGATNGCSQAEDSCEAVTCSEYTCVNVCG
jgi:hypothetical protein